MGRDDALEPEDSPEIIETEKKPSLRYRGRYLYSMSDPEGSAVKRAEAVHIDPGTLIFVPSPLLFYGFTELLRKLPENAHILCVETDQQLMSVSSSVMPDVLRKDKRITFVRTDDPRQIHYTLKSINPLRFRRAVLLPLSGGYALDAGRYKTLFETLENGINSEWQNRMTSIHMASLWFRNLFKNLAAPGNAVRSEESLPLSRPVLLTGAGISLEDSIPIIKHVRKDVFLLTVDTALPVLEKHRIAPDAVCMMEGQVYNIFDFLGSSSRSAALFADLCSYPGALRLFKGPVRLFCSEFTDSRLFQRLGDRDCLPWTVPPLGSVGVTALYIAKHITQAPVFFTGLDFAYTRGKTHARGAPAHTSLLYRSDRLHPPIPFDSTVNRSRVFVKGKQTDDGGDMISDFVLQSYLSPFNSVIGTDNRCYDISNFGAANRARHVVSMKEMETIISAFKKRREAPRPDSDTKARFVDPLKVREFFTEELSLLTKAYNAGSLYIRSDRSTGCFDHAVAALREVDYCYLHFADAGTNTAWDTGFIKRALISVQHYAGIIKNCLGILGF